MAATERGNPSARAGRFAIQFRERVERRLKRVASSTEEDGGRGDASW
jgi:hypothetical protein